VQSALAEQGPTGGEAADRGRPPALAGTHAPDRVGPWALAPLLSHPYILKMSNDYEQQARWAEYHKMIQALELGIPSHQSELDLPQADDVGINDAGPVMRAVGDAIELAPMTFSFPPVRAGGAPVFNFRSEGPNWAAMPIVALSVCWQLAPHRACAR
jgi:hypothetical protein